MSIDRSRDLASKQLPFFDFYPVCSRLLCELGQEFVNSLTEEQANPVKSQFVQRLVDQGFSRDNVELSWNFILENRVERVAGFYDQQPSQDRATSMGSSLMPSALHGDEIDENVFCFEDGRWVVRFLGKTIYPQDISGIKYLHWLISNPNQTFSPRVLYEDFGTRSRVSGPNSVSVDDAFRSGVGVNSAKPDVRLDQQAKSELLSRLEDIERELVVAKRIPDADQIEKLVDERIQIREELRKAFTPVGNRRIQEPDLVRRMKAVDIAIRRAKEKVQRAGHHDLLKHLNESVEIKVKSGCRYSPGNEISWRTKTAKAASSIKPR